MIDFLSDYWEKVFYGATATLASYGICYFKNAIDKKKANDIEIIRRLTLLEATGALTLSDNFFRSCRFYLGHQKISIQELRNLEKMYNAYHRMGGNGVGTELFERCKNLPLEKVGDYNKQI